jgi:hypothetical protein
MSIERNIQSILEVRKVLILDWDPIGIFTNSDFQYEYDSYDEYDSYLPEIIKIINNGGDILDLCKYLESIEDHMGVEQTSEDSLLQVSQKIFSIIRR